MAVISSIQAMMRSAGNNVKCNFLIVDKGFHFTRESFMVVASPETEIQIDDSLRNLLFSSIKISKKIQKPLKYIEKKIFTFRKDTI